jgi:hypothetical protein
MARQNQSREEQQEQQSADAVTAEAEKTVESADNAGGDVFGATQEPSPALQSEAVAEAAANAEGKTETEGSTIVGKNGTVTFVPSKA